MACRSAWIGGLIGAALIASVGAYAQSAQGQSPMAKDQSECAAAAKQSSGYDPSAPPPAPTKSQPKVGGRVKGAAAGGAAGAAAAEVRGQQYQAYDKASGDAKQEYRQNQSKDAAAAGAAIGASRQRQDRRADRRETKAAQDDLAAKQTAYDQAYKSCMAARGHTAP